MSVLVDRADCHMPLLAKSAVSHASAGNGPTTGDVHTHVLKIDLSKTQQFTADGLNISLDTLEPDRFACITRGGDWPGDADVDWDTDHADLGLLLGHWGEGCP